MRRYATRRGSIREFFGTTGLAGCYTLDTAATDTSGNARHGTITGATLAPGLIAGNSRYFNGAANDNILFGNNFAFDRTDAFSGIAWIKRSALGTYQMLFAKSSAATVYRGWAFLIDNTNFLRLFLCNDASANNYIIVSSQETIPLDTECIGFSYSGTSDASGISLIANGRLLRNTVVFNSLSATMVSTDGFYIGVRKPGAGAYQFPFTGYIDESAIWSRELPPQAFAEYYAWSTDTVVRKRMFVPYTLAAKYIPRRETLISVDDDLIINGTDGLNKPTEDALRRAAFWSGH